MKHITIALGADHRGFSSKEYLKQFQLFANYFITWIDVGAYTAERSDYPLFAISVAHYVQEKKADFGLLLCGTGVGMAIAANRFKNIFAAVAWNAEVARKSREDDNSNVLVIPADYVVTETCRAMIESWLGSEFKHERYEKRIAMINAIR